MSTRRDPLTSPGHVIALRDSREREVDRDVGGTYDTFVSELLTAASDAYSTGALVAAADPFVYSNVMLRWRQAVRTLAEQRGYLSDLQVIDLLERSDLPLRLYEAARDTLIAAQVNGWSEWWTKVQLGKALIPRHEDGVRRSLYRASITRTARTAATWSTALEVLGSPDASSYRWVARMDSRTRDEHREADGQTVPEGTPFEVDGHYLRGPGDPSAPTYLTASCRCIMVAVAD